MGGCTVEVEIVLLNILPVIGLAVGQPEQSFLENGVLTIPQGKRKAQSLLVITETRDAVLTPMIGARAGVIVGEVVPCIPVLAVVLADRAPLALAEIWPP